MIIVGITEDVLGKYSANDIIKIIAKFSDIKGGGRDDMAQAGGSQLGEKSEIIDAISKYIGSS
jgi:alanyl-tRNA synthetase